MKKKTSENVFLIFSEYLKSKGLRQTHERYAILSEIYLSDTHFSLQMLRQRLTKKRFLVSRNTLYNIIELLLDCGLIKRYQLEGNRTYYEKTKNIESHDHLVLTDTKEVLEFSDEQLSKIKKNIEKLFNVEIYNHSLIFYGRRKNKLKNEEN
jgi:Fur family ferric uptake transcriptional regulator